MSKIPKNYITVIALSVISLILGGTFFVISQNGSKQGSVQNSTQSSSSSQNSNFSTSSANSTNPNSPLERSLRAWEERPEGWSQSERGVSLSQNSTISSQFSNPVSSSNSQQSSNPSSNQNSPNNQTNNLQTYTNPNYPNLKINYDNSWKMEKENKKSYRFDELLDGSIKLTKANQELNFKLTPYGFGTCGSNYGPENGGTTVYYLKETFNINDEFYRNIWSYKENEVRPDYLDRAIKRTPRDAFDYESKIENSYKFCSNQIIIETNLVAKDTFKNYSSDFELQKTYPKDGNKIIYVLTIDYKGDPATFTQADEIIKNSVFK